MLEQFSRFSACCRMLAKGLLAAVMVFSTNSNVHSQEQSELANLSPTTAKELASNWRRLAEDGPQATVAALWFLSHPDTAAILFNERLGPLELTQAKYDLLLQQLASKNEQEWRAAYEELSYLDPRLLGDASELLGDLDEGPARQRLGGILSKYSLDKFLDVAIQERFFSKPFTTDPSKSGLAMVTHCSPLYQIPTTLKKIHYGQRRAKWDRLERALSILRACRTDQANAVIASIATGTPEAAPTQLAKKFLAADPWREHASLEEMLNWWNAMKLEGAASTYATLQFRARPSQAVKFFQTRLDPISLTENELEELLEQLFGEEEFAWKTAYEELEFKDPRILKTPMELYELVKDNPKSNRLMAILCGITLEQAPKYKLNLNEGDAFIAEAGGGVAYCKFASFSMGVENSIQLLGESPDSKKPAWNRARLAMATLQSIGSDAAISKVEQMSGGHNRAPPTEFAKEILKQQKK